METLIKIIEKATPIICICGIVGVGIVLLVENFIEW